MWRSEITCSGLVLPACGLSFLKETRVTFMHSAPGEPACHLQMQLFPKDQADERLCGHDDWPNLSSGSLPPGLPTAPCSA